MYKKSRRTTIETDTSLDTSVKSRDTTFWQVRASKNSHCTSTDASTPLITQVCVLFQHHSEATLLSSCDSSDKRSTDSYKRQVIRNLISYTKTWNSKDDLNNNIPLDWILSWIFHLDTCLFSTACDPSPPRVFYTRRPRHRHGSAVGLCPRLRERRVHDYTRNTFQKIMAR